MERINDLLYYLSLGIERLDVGHYLRAGLVVSECSTYVTTPDGPPCNATFGDTGVGSIGRLAAGA